MGQGIEAFCECGYRSDILNIGVGMKQSFEFNNELCLVQCDSCFEFSTRTAERKIIRCRKCRNKAEYVKGINWEEQHYQTKLCCPGCRESKIQFEVVLNWD